MPTVYPLAHLCDRSFHDAAHSSSSFTVTKEWEEEWQKRKSNSRYKYCNNNDRSTKQVLVLQYNRKHRKGNSGVHGCAANLASLGHQLKTGAKRIPQMVQKTFLKALDRDQDEKNSASGGNALSILWDKNVQKTVSPVGPLLAFWDAKSRSRR